MSSNNNIQVIELLTKELVLSLGSPLPILSFDEKLDFQLQTMNVRQLGKHLNLSNKLEIYKLALSTIEIFLDYTAKQYFLRKCVMSILHILMMNNVWLIIL